MIKKIKIHLDKGAVALWFSLEIYFGLSLIVRTLILLEKYAP